MPWLTRLFLVQEVAAVDAKLAQRAQAKYKSCVRTTLRLTAGYECQDLQVMKVICLMPFLLAVLVLTASCCFRGM